MQKIRTRFLMAAACALALTATPASAQQKAGGLV